MSLACDDKQINAQKSIILKAEAKDPSKLFQLSLSIKFETTPLDFFLFFFNYFILFFNGIIMSNLAN